MTVLPDLLDRSRKVFSLAGRLGRAFDEQKRSYEHSSGQSAWNTHALLFNEFYSGLLALRDEMENPPEDFAPVAWQLLTAARIAKNIRDSRPEDRFDFFPDLNTAFQSVWEAIKRVSSSLPIDDPLGFVEQYESPLSLNRLSASPSDHLAFLNQVRDDVHIAAEAKQQQVSRGYGNDTLRSMIEGIGWVDARARLAAIPNLNDEVRANLNGILSRNLTVGTVDHIDALLTPAIWELQNSLHSAQSPSVKTGQSLTRKPSDAMNDSTVDVLISWSKHKSRKAATAIYEWLPTVLPGVRPWMSDKDIDKGTQWFRELQSLLGSAKLCIVCVTEENVRSPWLYYETGAIATKGSDVRVCPYLVGVGPSIISDGPLGKFQCTESNQNDTLLLIKSLNKVLAIPHDVNLLTGNFEPKWKALESQLQAIAAENPQGQAEFTRTEADELAGVNLTSEARTMLVEAAKGNGRVIRSRTRSGTGFVAGSTQLDGEGDPRMEALWEAALELLVDNQLLSAEGDAGVMVKLTASGYKVADKLIAATQ